MATAKDRKIATTGSGHVAPGPAPATSMAPPTPVSPVPAPFMYISKSSTATDTSCKLKISGHPVLHHESNMKVEQPGNAVTRTTGGDIVTHQVNGITSMYEGCGTVLVGGKQVACTGHHAYMNIIDGSKIAQTRAELVEAIDAASAGGEQYAAKDEVTAILDPISPVSGVVLDQDRDLVLPGIFDVEFKRLYNSGRHRERSPLGVGGFTHNLHQYVMPAEGGILLRTGGGYDERIALDDAGRGRHRAQRLRVIAHGSNRVEVCALDNRRTALFERLRPDDDRLPLRAIVDGFGRRAELHYEHGRLVRVDGPSRRTLTFAYDERARLGRVEVWSQGALQCHMGYRYNDDDELVEAVDALDQVTRYRYDGHHRMVQKTLPTGFSVHYRYDESGRCLRTWGDNQILAGDIEYDLEKKVTTVSGNARPCIYGFDDRGMVISQASSDGTLIRNFEYDDDGLLTAFRDGVGNVRRYQHDASGCLTEYVDPEGRTSRRELSDGLCVKQIDPGGLEFRYDYDSHDALIRVRYPSGVEVHLEYDEGGRIARVLCPEGTTAFAYDEQDHPIEERGPLGEVSRYGFDALGRVTSITDPLGRRLDLAYDALGRCIEQHDGNGSVVRFAYDALDRPTANIRDRQRGVEQAYGGAHALVSQTMEDGSVWRFEHDRLERLRKVITPQHDVWEYVYNRAGLIAEERTFDGRVTRFDYDRAGRLVRSLRGDDYVEYHYDQSGIAIREESSTGDVYYEHDESGRILRAVVDEPLGPTELRFEYDACGRIVAEIQDGEAVHYRYNDSSMMVARVLPGGETTRYRYDAYGALVELEHQGQRVSIRRDAVGKDRERLFHGPKVVVESEYDMVDQVTRQTVTLRSADGGRGLLERSYDYDGRGWPVVIDDSLRGRRRFEHDARGLLRRAAGRQLDERFDYNASGSLVGAHLAAPGAPWAVGPGNVLVLTSDAELEYDNQCRRIARRDDAGTVEYFWDARQQLREVRFPDGDRVVYVYDAFGRRVRKDFYHPLAFDAEAVTDPNVRAEDVGKPYRTVRFLWEGRVLAAEIDSLRGTRIYVHEPHTFSPLLHVDDGKIRYYVTDHLGAASELVDETGSIVWAPERTAFGSVVEPAPSKDQAAREETPFRLLGHYHDDETGLSYARHRYFEPATGRWLSPDPLGLTGGRDPFGYNGNPLTHSDPLGLRCVIGNPLFDQALQWCMRIPPKAGYYDVIAHGTPYTLAAKNPGGAPSTHYKPSEVTGMLLSNGDYVPGTPIRLVACNPARIPGAQGGFAERLGNQMEVPVNAPNRFLHMYSNGQNYVADKKGLTDPVNPGWKVQNDDPGQFVDIPYTPPGSPPAPTPTGTAPPSTTP
jgi:RHS repeat-associated protein